MFRQVSTTGKWLAVLALALITVMVMPAKPAYAAALTVNSTGDQSDASPGNGVCQTSVGTCTLRAAIQEANALPGGDDITFSIGAGPQTIYPGSMLPEITQPVKILGDTQPGYAGTPLIRVDGNNLVWDGIRLKPGSNNSVIKGLMIVRFRASGIYIDRGDLQTIKANYIGTDGTTALGNRAGIYVSASTNTLIGGSSSTDSNLISGNNYEGIQLVNGTTGTLIYGNLIGTNAAGTLAIGNSYGIKVDNSPNNVVGNSIVPSSRNIISGNNKGILLRNGTSGTLIQGNLIGTNAAGTGAVGNISSGIEIDNSDNNQIGGDTSAARNIISGNPSYGAYVLNGASGNVFQGNYFGPDITGTIDITPSTYYAYGIVVYGSPNTFIGGTWYTQGNLFSGLHTGIQLVYAQTAGTTVQYNSFGRLPSGNEDPNLYNVENIELISTNNIAIGSVYGNTLAGGTTSVNIVGSSNITIKSLHLSDFVNGIVATQSSSITVISSFFRDSQQSAIWLDASTALLAGSTNNCFFENVDEALRSENPTTQTFENNWWHSVSGPSGSGYTGQGAGIVGAVDASPWLVVSPDWCWTYYNHANNSSFEDGSGSTATGWSGSGGGRVCDIGYYSSCSYSFVATGWVIYPRYVEQTIPAIVGNTIRAFAVSKALNVPSAGIYRLMLIVYYVDGTTDFCEATFSSGTHDWEYKGCEIIVTKEVSTAKVRFENNKSSGTVWFDWVSTYIFPP